MRTAPPVKKQAENKKRERTLWKKHILVELKFTDELMGSESANIKLWRGNPHQLLGVKLECGNTIVYTVAVGDDESKKGVARMSAQVKGTPAFKRAVLNTVTEKLQRNADAGLPAGWVDGNKLAYTFVSTVPVGAITYILMKLRNLA